MGERHKRIIQEERAETSGQRSHLMLKLLVLRGNKTEDSQTCTIFSAKKKKESLENCGKEIYIAKEGTW